MNLNHVTGKIRSLSTDYKGGEFAMNLIEFVIWIAFFWVGVQILTYAFVSLREMLKAQE